MKTELTQARVKELFSYDPEIGKLIYKNSVGNHVKKDSIAGSLCPNGYIYVGINRKRYKHHRLVFLYHKGYLPPIVDHIDGDRVNDKIENLRKCTAQQNGFNSKIRKNNTAGIKGVSWSRDRRLWVAQIMVDGKTIPLGRFWDKEVAAQVVRIKRIELHGEFCNHG